MDVNVSSQKVADILSDEAVIQNGLEVEESGEGALPPQEAEEKTEQAKNEGKTGKFILVGQRGRRWLKWIEERDA